MANIVFNNAYGFTQSIPDVVGDICVFMQEAPTREYSIIIGTDSELIKNNNADFVTAIVVHRKGNGGRYFWRRVTHGPYHTIRDRIIQEVVISLDLAQTVLATLQERKDIPNWNFEIHADVGNNGKTSALIQEVVGMIRAYNFEARTKPESYAASSVADRHV